jgi:hypothetical protein
LRHEESPARPAGVWLQRGVGGGSDNDDSNDVVLSALSAQSLETLNPGFSHLGEN